jgi:hypothetical protein
MKMASNSRRSSSRIFLMGPTTFGFSSASSIFLAHCSIVRKDGSDPFVAN